MTPFPYLLYFPITGFSFSFFSFGFSAFLPWIALAAVICIALWLMSRELEKSIRAQFEEQFVLGYLEAHRLLFTRWRAGPRIKLSR